MNRRLFLLALLTAALLAPTAADAGNACVSYSVTTPQTGTVSDTKCPVPLPGDWGFFRRVWDCTGVPPLGVSYCITVSTYSPL